MQIKGEVVGPFTTQVRVKQYYELDITAPNHLKIKHGNEGSIDLSIFNRGNGDDRPRVVNYNMTELSGKGIDIEYSQDKMFLPSNKSKDSTLLVKVDKWAPTGDHVVRIRVISAQAEELGEVSDIVDKDLLISVEGPIDPYIVYPISIFSIVILLSLISALLIGSSLRRRNRRAAQIRVGKKK